MLLASTSRDRSVLLPHRLYCMTLKHSRLSASPLRWPTLTRPMTSLHRQRLMGVDLSYLNRM